MKRNTWIVALIVCLVCVVLIALTCRVTYIPDPVVETYVNEKGETVVVEPPTVPEQYCIDNWDSKIVPTVAERGIEVATFVADVTADLGAAGQKYGYRANETSAWGFCVKGKAKVIELSNPDSANKVQLVLDVAPYDGVADCKLHFGKVFATNIKNAVRDSVAFLKLDDFANQVEFAGLSNAFNAKIKEDIYAKHTAADLLNKEIEFTGCATLQKVSLDDLVIIPVTMTVAGE